MSDSSIFYYLPEKDVAVYTEYEYDGSYTTTNLYYDVKSEEFSINSVDYYEYEEEF